MSAPKRDFQITLFSDSSMRFFPNNKPNHFHVHLPTPLLMRDFGPWQVALVDIELPHTWNNFEREVLIAFEAKFAESAPPPPPQPQNWDEQYAIGASRETKEGFEYREASIRPCYFEHVSELGKFVARLFNFLFRHRSGSLAYRFDQRTGKGRFYASGVEQLRCICDSDYLFRSLGLDPQALQLTDVPRERARLVDVDNVFVYSDLCTLTNVGGVEVPLLATLPVKRKRYGSVTHWAASPAYYVPLEKTEEVHSIEVDLRTGSGDPVPFTEGQVVCRLHFSRVHE